MSRSLAPGDSQRTPTVAEPCCTVWAEHPATCVPLLFAVCGTPAPCTGMSRPDFGSTHIPGYLPRPDPQDAAAASTPAQSGMGPVVAPRLYPRSSCPPAWQEPLPAPADADAADVIAARQADREALEDSELMNRLVYDSLQPPVPGKERENCAGAQAGSSSCRTTTSSKSLNICTGAISADETRAFGESAPEQQQQQEQQAGASYAYAPGLAPWYVPEGTSDTTLVFESRFESGNLRRAIQVRRAVACSTQWEKSHVVCCSVLLHMPCCGCCADLVQLRLCHTSVA
jgi:hypothetical protein